MRMIKKGSTGESVVLVQERLCAHGFTVKVDGDFGERTEDAVEQFQASAGLKVDGKVGRKTLDALLVDKRVEIPASVYGEEKQWMAEQIPAGTSKKIRNVLGVAISYMGVDEDPAGSNRGPVLDELVTGYDDYWKIDGDDDEPWCVKAVSVWIGVGLELGSNSKAMNWKKHPFGHYYGGTSQVENWGKRNNAFITDKEVTWPTGAVFTMGRGRSGSDPSTSVSAGHVGLIVRDNGDDTVTTIEGNVSNRVWSGHRKKSELRGCVVWG